MLLSMGKKWLINYEWSTTHFFLLSAKCLTKDKSVHRVFAQYCFFHCTLSVTSAQTSGFFSVTLYITVPLRCFVFIFFSFLFLLCLKSVMVSIKFLFIYICCKWICGISVLLLLGSLD